METSRRGLREIRTLSGSVHQVFLPHQLYLKLSSLEMEKVRRRKERKSTSQRMANIDARLKQIEAEKAALRQFLEPRNGGQPGSEPKPAPRQSTGGFKLRY